MKGRTSTTRSCRRGNREAARTTFLLTWMLLAALTLAISSGTLAHPTINVDMSAIDARKDLTNAEKAAVKQAIKDTVKANLDEAFGACNTTIETDPKKGGNRYVKINNEQATQSLAAEAAADHNGKPRLRPTPGVFP